MKSRKLRIIKYTSQSYLRANRSSNDTVPPFGICTKHGISINTFSSRDESFQITPKSTVIRRHLTNGGQFSEVVKMKETNSLEDMLGSQRGRVERKKSVLTENENPLNHSAPDVTNQCNSENDSLQSTVKPFKRIPKNSKLSRVEEVGVLLENSGVIRVDVETVEVDTTQNDEMINLLNSNTLNVSSAKYRPKFVDKSDNKALFNSSVKSLKENAIPSNLSEVNFLVIIITYKNIL